jgi:hypothetical protein
MESIDCVREAGLTTGEKVVPKCPALTPSEEIPGRFFDVGEAILTGKEVIDVLTQLEAEWEKGGRVRGPNPGAPELCTAEITHVFVLSNPNGVPQLHIAMKPLEGLLRGKEVLAKCWLTLPSIQFARPMFQRLGIAQPTDLAKADLVGRRARIVVTVPSGNKRYVGILELLPPTTDTSAAQAA